MGHDADRTWVLTLVLFTVFQTGLRGQTARPAVWDRVEAMSGQVCAALSLDGAPGLLAGNPATGTNGPLELGLSLLIPSTAPSGSEWLLFSGDGRIRLASNSSHHLQFGGLYEDGGIWSSYDAQAQYLGDRRSLWGAGLFGWSWRGDGMVSLGAGALLAPDPDQPGILNLMVRSGLHVAPPASLFSWNLVLESPWLGRSILRPRFLVGTGFSPIPELKFGAEMRWSPDEDPEMRLGFRFAPFPVLKLGASMGFTANTDPWWQLGLSVTLEKLQIFLAHRAGGGRYEVNEVGIRHGI